MMTTNPNAAQSDQASATPFQQRLAVQSQMLQQRAVEAHIQRLEQMQTQLQTQLYQQQKFDPTTYGVSLKASQFFPQYPGVDLTQLLQAGTMTGRLKDVADAAAESERMTKSPTMERAKEWDSIELSVLQATVNYLGTANEPLDWVKVSQHLPGRSPVSCELKWRSKNSEEKDMYRGKGTWTPQEDEQLRAVVARFGPNNWASVIAPHMTNRQGKQCRERWRNNLDPNLKKISWTTEEERIATAAHQTLGNKWAKIAKLLPGRSDNDVKNHFYAILRRTRKRSSSDDGSDSDGLLGVPSTEGPESLVLKPDTDSGSNNNCQPGGPDNKKRKISNEIPAENPTEGTVTTVCEPRDDGKNTAT